MTAVMSPPRERLLSVEELQLALRTARSGRLDRTLTTNLRQPVVDPLRPSDLQPTLPRTGDLVAIVAAHGGAGGSTVALAVASAAASTGRQVQLIEWCEPSRSGLITASTSELGTVGDGRWRRGRRGAYVVIDRHGERQPSDLPTPPEATSLRLADLGTYDTTCTFPTLLVCRANVPGIRAAEHALSRLADVMALAAIGPRRWPGAVASSTGAKVRRMRHEDLVVPVPLDARLQTRGITGDPLPKAIVRAGARLLALLDQYGHNTPASSASPPCTEGASR